LCTFGDFGLLSRGVCCEIGRFDGVTRLVGGISAGSQQSGGQQRIDDSGNYPEASPFQAPPIMLTALMLGGLIVAVKGIYRDGNGLLLGGAFLSAVSAFALTW